MDSGIAVFSSLASLVLFVDSVLLAHLDALVHLIASIHLFHMLFTAMHPSSCVVGKSAQKDLINHMCNCIDIAFLCVLSVHICASVM